MHTLPYRRVALVGISTACAALLVSCGNADKVTDSRVFGSSSTATQSEIFPTFHSGMGHTPNVTATPGMGLQATTFGLTLVPTTTTLPTESGPWSFRIVTDNGVPVRKFTPEQTKLMHLYLVRADLTEFNHLHPVMAPDGTWKADLPGLPPGTYRAYTQFTTNGDAGQPVTPVLSIVATVPGSQATVPLPDPTAETSVDGYDLAVDASALVPGKDSELTVTVTKDGQPVTDLQPYLDSYAHVTAIRAQDMAFAHLHPEVAAAGDRGGPTLKLRATLPDTTGDSNGLWRVYLQFQTRSTLHTAAITVKII